MDLRARLSLLPPGSLVPAEWVLAELEREQGGECPTVEEPAGADLTVEQVAERMGRHANTVRDWCRAGRLRCYKLNGRDYRVTEAALREFIDGQTADRPRPKPGGKKANLGSWRELRKAG